MKKYNYLITYSGSATGRSLLVYNKPIVTNEDIKKIEESLGNKLGEDLFINSFQLLNTRR